MLPATLLLIVLISCQDQIIKEISKSTVTQTSDYPPEVKADLATLQVKFPEAKFSYLEGTEDDMNKLLNEAGKTDYVKKVYVFKPDANTVMKGAILNNVVNHATDLKMEGDVYTIVEEPASPVKGMKDFYRFIGENMRYPKEARNAGVEGRVFVRFMINEQGSLSNFNIIRGIGMGCDEEAVRVLSMSPPWKPGKQGGVAVKSTFNLAVIFKLDGSGVNHSTSEADKPTAEDGTPLNDVVVTAYVPSKDLVASTQHLVDMSGSIQSGALALPPDGMTAFGKFIADNLKYPEAAVKANVEGRVHVMFTITEAGKLIDFKLIKGIGSGCDEEAVQVLKQSPDWIPAKLNGRPVPSSFSLAIVFALDNQSHLDELNYSSTVQQNSDRHEFVQQGNHPKELTLGDYVIGGAFSKEERAQQLIEDLKKLGFTETGYGYLSNRGRWFIYLARRDDIEAAKRARDKYQKSEMFKDAWLLTVHE